MNRSDVVNGWLFTGAALFVGLLIVIDPARFVSSTAWQTVIAMAPGGRGAVGWFILLCGFAMAVVLIYERFVFAPFIAASLWFIFVTVGLVRSTFTTTTGGTPGFVIWGVMALLLMNYGIAHIPSRGDA